MEYRDIVRLSTAASMTLWVAAASLWVTAGPASFAIVAVLASVFQVIGVNGARREGWVRGRSPLADRVLDKVGK